METATNKPLPYTTLYQLLFTAPVWVVQVLPSVDVITALLAEEALAATETNFPFPKVRPRHELLTGGTTVVQVTPLGEVMKSEPVAVFVFDATKTPFP
jgi:hypothetical protein